MASAPSNAAPEQTLTLRSCRIDWIRAEAVHADRVERLTNRELDLIRYLVEHADRVVGRDELLIEVFGFAPTIVSRAADTTVRRVREKIEADPQQPDHLLTAFGEGYRFVPDLPMVAVDAVDATEAEPFIGREAEITELTGALRSPGLVTLLGPPGVGKTRLAMHVAFRMRRTLVGGTVLVDVTDTRDLPEVAQAIAHVLGIDQGEKALAALRRVGDVLRARGPCLLVIDNCEGALNGVVDAVAAMRVAAPQARFLATSRAALGGAQAREVTLTSMTQTDAVALFELFVRRVRPDFDADEARPTVLRLVERLERLPLALALAAGRASAMSPRAILDRLDDRFRLLASRERGVDPRQATLRAALDWSWEMLTPSERTTLAACSAFRGGFTLEAAAFVVDHADTGPLVRALCRQSLLEERGDRIGGYAFIREYCTERLASDPVEELRVFERHGLWFADYAERFGKDDVALAVERGNVIEAARRALQRRDSAIGSRVILSALDVIGHQGPFELGLELASGALELDLDAHTRLVLGLRLALVEQWTGHGDPVATMDRMMAVAVAQGDPALLGIALRSRGTLRRLRGQHLEALVDLQGAVDAGRVSSDGAPLCDGLNTYAHCLRELGRNDEARAVFTEIASIAEAGGLRTHLAHAHGNLALIERRLGNVDEARRLYESALAMQVADNDLRGESIALTGLGNLELELGRLERAHQHYVRALALAREVGMVEGEARLLGNVGLLERSLGNLDSARDHLFEALRLFERMGESRQAAIARGNLGEVWLAGGDPAQAVSMLESSCEDLRRLGDGPSTGEMLGPLADAYLELGELDLAEERLTEAERRIRDARNPLVLAQVLSRVGRVHLARGRREAATACLVEARQAAERAGAQPTSDTARLVLGLSEALTGRST